MPVPMHALRRCAHSGLLFLTGIAWAGDGMNVSICNFGYPAARTVALAEQEAAYLFSCAGVEVHWRGCGQFETGKPVPPFILHLEREPAGPDGGILDAMGCAFLPANGTPRVAAIYFDQVEKFADERQYPDIYQILGCSMAHELGHLLLGPRHHPNGIMRAKWGRKDLEAICHRNLKFTSQEGLAIRRALGSRD